jgi:hypothetical protein
MELLATPGGFSSAGRAPALQAGGRRFDPVNLHQFDSATVRYGRISIAHDYRNMKAQTKKLLTVHKYTK